MVQKPRILLLVVDRSSNYKSQNVKKEVPLPSLDLVKAMDLFATLSSAQTSVSLNSQLQVLNRQQSQRPSRSILLLDCCQQSTDKD